MSAQPQARSAPRLREAVLEDYEEIVALQAAHGLLIPGSYQEWAHLWLNNPVHRGLECWPIGWVLEDAGGRIVGSMSNIPLAYELGGRRLLVASGRGWAVAGEHRAFAFSLLDRLIRQEGIDLYLNSSVSASSCSAVRFFGCRPVPRGRWHEAGFWVTHYRGFSEFLLRYKSAPCAGAAKYPLAAGLYAKDRFAGRRLPAGAEFEVCSEFDERFDEFWETLRRQRPRVLLGVRTAETLRWHFRYALAGQRAWVVAATRGARLAAFAIFDRQDKPALGLTRMRVVDVQALDGGRSLVGPLLGWALEKCRRERVHVLEDRGFALEIDAPYTRKLPCQTFVYHTTHSGLAEALQAPEAWAPSLFDGDASL